MGSLWDQFTDTLSRGFDQVNPFDNGKDWNNRVGNPAPIRKRRDEPVAPNMGNGPLRMQPQTRPAAPRPVVQPVAQKPQRFGDVDSAFKKPEAPKPVAAPDGSITDTRPMPMRVPGDEVDKANRALRGNKIVDRSSNDVSAAAQLRAELSNPRPNKARVQALTQQVRGNTVTRFKQDASNEKVRQIAETVATPVKVIDSVMKTTGQAINSTPEVIARSIMEPLTGNAFRKAEDAVDTSGTHTNPVAKYLFGEKVQSYQGQARDMQIAAQNSDNKIIKGAAPYAPFISPALAALDLAGVKGGKIANDVLPVGTKKPSVQAPTPVSTPSLQKPVQAPEQAMARVVEAPTKPSPIDQLSKTAKNSLENDTTGIKPDGVQRSGGFVENGTAKPVEIRRLEDGSTVIVDGRHTLEYARQNGITDFPIKDVTEQYAPKDAKPFSPESKNILDRLDDEIKKEDDIIRQEAEFEIERLNEMIMDPATPDAKIPILTQQVLDVKAQLARVDKNITTPIEAVTKRDTTLDGLKVDPKTTIRDRQGNLVDTNTGEIINADMTPTTSVIEPTKLGDAGTDVRISKTAMEYAAEKLDAIAPELKPDTRPLPERVAALPARDAARVEDLPTIERSVTDVEKELDNLAAQTTPEQRMTWAREMADFDRNGTPLSDESKALQDQIQDLMDAFKGERNDFGDARREGMYLPQATDDMLQARESAQMGTTFLDMVNSSFDYKATRKDAIELDALADPIETLKSYNQKWHFDNYGHLKEAEKLAEKGYTKPVEYLNTRKDIAKQTAASVDKEITKALSREAKGKVTTKPKMDKHYDVYGELVKNFERHGNPAEIVTSDVRLPMAANLHTTRELWKKTGIYDAAGMGRYDKAQGQGMGVFEEIGGDNALKQFKAMGYDEGRAEYIATVKGFYDDVYESDFKAIMDKYQFDEIVTNGAGKSFYFESGQGLASLERTLAAEKMLHFAERTRFTDKHMTKKFKNEVEYILKDSRRAMGVGDKVTNFLTSMYHTGALGLNPQSAVQQISELARVAGMTDGETTFRALYDGVRLMKPHEVRKYLDSYGLHDSFTKQMLNKGDDVIREGKPAPKKSVIKKTGDKVAGGYDWVQEFTMKGFNAFETAKDVTLLKALERKHAGISDPYNRRTAILDEFQRAGFKGGHYGAIEATNRSNIARLGLQFGQYTMKDWGLMAEKARNGDWGYVTRTIGGKAVTAVPLYAIFGTSIAFTLGLSEYKGGPAVGLATLTFTEIQNEDKRMKDAIEKGTGEQEFNWDNVKNAIAKKQAALTVPGGNYLLNKLGVQDLSEAGRNADFLRHDTALGDMRRGYNEAQKGYNDDGTGNARFASPDDLWNQAKAILGGAYNTDEANKYFENGFFDLDFWGLTVGKTQELRPVTDKYQKKIDENPLNTAAYIEESRAQQAEKKKYFDENPALKETWDAMNKTTWNKETQKNESDTISPERWKTVLGSKDGKMFEYMRDRAIRNNKDFGDAIDPIFLLTDKGQINDALTIRAAFTGDDKEKKSSLKEQQWYTKYSEDLDKYYEQKDVQAKDPNSDFGSTKRATEYYELSQKNPYVATPKSAVLTQYEAIKASGDEAGRKAFYKANADALGAEYEALSQAAFNWTNQMRKLEGAAPLTREVWENPTYGYKSDGILNGKDDTEGGYKKFGSGGGKNTVSVRTGNFGKAGTGTPNAIKTGKVKTVARKARTRGGKTGKITFKRSKTV